MAHRLLCQRTAIYRRKSLEVITEPHYLYCMADEFLRSLSDSTILDDKAISPTRSTRYIATNLSCTVQPQSGLQPGIWATR
jgi:hypothetical protein